MEDWTKIVLALLLLMAAAFVIYPRENLPNAPAGPAKPDVRMELSPAQVHENQSVRARIVRTPECAGEARLQLDGQALELSAADDGSTDVEADFQVAAGVHRLIFSQGDCRAAQTFEAKAPPCQEGAKRACSDTRGCEGRQVCQNGIWSACRVPPAVCSPGAQVPCMIDNCRWGLATCNSCGTAWSLCR